MASPHAEWVSGNIFIRPWRMAKGERIDGHKHLFDHTSIVFTGGVHVKARTPDGQMIEREFHAPSHVLIRAGVEHEIVALEDRTEFWCVYSHRDAQGQVTQVYDGWMESYR